MDELAVPLHIWSFPEIGLQPTKIHVVVGFSRFQKPPSDQGLPPWPWKAPWPLGGSRQPGLVFSSQWRLFSLWNLVCNWFWTLSKNHGSDPWNTQQQKKRCIVVEKNDGHSVCIPLKSGNLIWDCSFQKLLYSSFNLLQHPVVEAIHGNLPCWAPKTNQIHRGKAVETPCFHPNHQSFPWPQPQTQRRSPPKSEISHRQRRRPDFLAEGRR